MSCEITGTAAIHRIDMIDGSEGDYVWEYAEAAVHVTVELIDSMTEKAMAFFTETYELGEPCPDDSTLRHARLKAGYGGDS